MSSGIISSAKNRAAIAEMLYDELYYAYCNNCENGSNKENEPICYECYRKYQYWRISKDTCEHLTDKIIEILEAE